MRTKMTTAGKIPRVLVTVEVAVEVAGVLVVALGVVLLEVVLLEAVPGEVVAGGVVAVMEPLAPVMPTPQMMSCPNPPLRSKR